MYEFSCISLCIPMCILLGCSFFCSFHLLHFFARLTFSDRNHIASYHIGIAMTVTQLTWWYDHSFLDHSFTMWVCCCSCWFFFDGKLFHHQSNRNKAKKKTKISTTSFDGICYWKWKNSQFLFILYTYSYTSGMFEICG